MNSKETTKKLQTDQKGETPNQLRTYKFGLADDERAFLIEYKPNGEIAALRKTDGQSFVNFNGGVIPVPYRYGEIENAIKDLCPIVFTNRPWQADDLFKRGINATCSPTDSELEHALSWLSDSILVIPERKKRAEFRYYESTFLPHVDMLCMLPVLEENQSLDQWITETNINPALFDRLLDEVGIWFKGEGGEQDDDEDESTSTIPLCTITATDLANTPDVPNSWLVEGLIPFGANGGIIGPPKLNKTSLAVELAIALTTGKPFLDRFPVSEVAPCLFIEEEMNRLDIKDRFKRIAKARGISPEQFNALPVEFMIRQFIKIPARVDEITEIIKKRGSKVVICDALTDFHSADENLAHAMQPVLEGFSRISAATGASIVLIHHMVKTKKGGFGWEKLRGSNVILAWGDWYLGLDGHEGQPTARCHTLLRNAAAPNPFYVKRVADESNGTLCIEVISDADGKKGHSLRLKSENFTETIQKHMESLTAGAVKDHVIQIIGGNRKNVISAFNELEAAGKLVKQGKLYWWHTKFPATPSLSPDSNSRTP